VKIGPIVTYCAKSWALASKMEIALMMWERKILRKIYGSKYENGSRGIKMNES
jgi:hypothetical protein